MLMQKACSKDAYLDRSASRVNIASVYPIFRRERKIIGFRD